ncbi:MAG: polymer-forming cytoskeletal protein [Bacteroidales bacterium]|nr:polymer-forming cytoskeletal protein [Bacteroidales bacterium]
MAKLKETEIPSINLLGSGTTLKGDLTLKGDFRIDGKLVGKIDCKGKIVVGTSGIIDGEIICQNADLSGKIKAKVKVAQLLTLKETAQFSGEIVTNKLAIEPGASFSGSCQMEGIARDNKPIETIENIRPEEKP